MSEHDVREDDHGAHNPGAAADDDLPWMAHLSALSDRDVDELLAGRVPDGADELAPLAHIAGSLRARAAAEPVPPMLAELVEQIAARRVARLDARRPRRRARVAVVAAAGALAAASFGAAAAENALPRPIQDAVSSAADLVGVEVPRAAERQSEAPPATTPGGAVPARPADPGERGEPATPATPATPAAPSAGAAPELRDGHGLSGSVPSTVPEASGASGQPDSTAGPAADGQGDGAVGERGGSPTSRVPAGPPSTQPPGPQTRQREAPEPTAQDSPTQPDAADSQATTGT